MRRVPGVARRSRGARNLDVPRRTCVSQSGNVTPTLASPHRGTIRILSVGCSTGEEVYSLAISLREAGFDPSQFQVLGTDLSRRSLELARSGELQLRSFREPDDEDRRDVRPVVRASWRSWRVRDELHNGVEFRWEKPGPGRVSCRRAPLRRNLLPQRTDLLPHQSPPHGSLHSSTLKPGGDFISPRRPKPASSAMPDSAVSAASVPLPSDARGAMADTLQPRRSCHAAAAEEPAPSRIRSPTRLARCKA